jgi:glycosyltransferase involved in cell wall biosynthesis
MNQSSPSDRSLITIFIPSLHGGGAERVMLTFATECAKMGHSVDLVLVKRKGALTEQVPRTIRVVDLGCARTVYALPKLITYLVQNRPRVLYSTILHANVLAALALQCAGTPTTLIMRESNSLLSEKRLSISRRATLKLLPYAYRRAHHIIAVSQGVKEELTSIEPRLTSAISVLPTPVISSQILTQGEEPIPHPWFAAGEPPVILAAGRLQPHKGFRVLLRAYAQLLHMQPARLMILGEGPEREPLERMARELGISELVSLPGFIRNPFPYMNQAGAFVLASEYEGLPNVLIQALAFGTPVVATDCIAGPSEILENGRWGELVPIGDEATMTSAMIRALATPKQPLAAKAMRLRYSVDAAVQQYLALGLPEYPAQERLPDPERLVLVG